jgi:hypothetical protein
MGIQHAEVYELAMRTVKTYFDPRTDSDILAFCALR